MGTRTSAGSVSLLCDPGPVRNLSELLPVLRTRVASAASILRVQETSTLAPGTVPAGDGAGPPTLSPHPQHAEPGPRGAGRARWVCPWLRAGDPVPSGQVLLSADSPGRDQAHTQHVLEGTSGCRRAPDHHLGLRVPMGPLAVMGRGRLAQVGGAGTLAGEVGGGTLPTSDAAARVRNEVGAHGLPPETRLFPGKQQNGVGVQPRLSP